VNELPHFGRYRRVAHVPHRRRVVAAQIEIESKVSKRFIMLWLQALIADTVGAFNTGFDTVNLHRPTAGLVNQSCSTRRMLLSPRM